MMVPSATLLFFFVSAFHAHATTARKKFTVRAIRSTAESNHATTARKKFTVRAVESTAESKLQIDAEVVASPVRTEQGDSLLAKDETVLVQVDDDNAVADSSLAERETSVTAAEASSSVVAAGTAMCAKRFWDPIKEDVKMHDDDTTFAITGDIPLMWIRDSAATLRPYIPLAKDSKKIQRLLEGAMRSQAKYIAIDPYANAFTDKFSANPSHEDLRLLRGGYVGTANYEMDDGAYFFRFLNDYFDKVPSSTIFTEPQIHEAVRTQISLYRLEREHNRSHYNYPKFAPFELPGGSSGKKVGYTGMVWNAFRPSDDPHKYGYHIPGNIFLASTLPFVKKLATDVFGDHQLAHDAQELQHTILRGIAMFGTKEMDGGKVYCYEVDGLGDCNIMDDANVPSLLSIPYLDPTGKNHDRDVYAHTRRMILSEENPWFFQGSAGTGIGSPHTGQGRVWPLSLVMEALTAETAHERESIIAELMKTSKGGQRLVESFHKDNANDVTREWFAWPNALFAELMQSLGAACGTIEDAPSMSEVTPRDPVGGPTGGTFYTTSVDKLRVRPSLLVEEEEEAHLVKID